MIKQIAGIRFELLSPAEIRKLSHLRVTVPDTYGDDGFPLDMGLMDQRIGVVDPGLRCRVCNGRPGECPGHFGHIELAAHVIHVKFVKHIYKILRAICAKCSKLKFTLDQLLDLAKDESLKSQLKSKSDLDELDPQQISEIIKSLESQGVDLFKEASKQKTCPYCGEIQPEISYERPTSFFQDGEKLTPSEIRQRFEAIPDNHVRLMGINPEAARPEWMILSVLPVPPATMRPSIILESGQRSEDDLTHKLVDIIRINQRFQENVDIGAPQLITEDFWELLQYHVTTYIDNDVPGIPPAKHRSGRPLRTLAQRLRGKEGRFRWNLSGKRVNFSSRCVISPDPNLGIDEVGVPEIIARELTITEHASSTNLDYLRELVLNGEALYVKRPDGKRIKLNQSNLKEIAAQLDLGWSVERRIRDGDIALFNRQPSLHRMSMMAHRIKILPGDHQTFRLNPIVCPPFNADFDGDEMNLHIPQSPEARAEAELLMDVKNSILSPRFGGVIIGGIHDHITGLYLLTHGERRLDKHQASYLLSKTDIRKLPQPAGYERGIPYWTGKQLFSLLLPPRLNMSYRASICKRHSECMKQDCPYDAYVLIRSGRLICGTLDEKSFGAFKGLLIDRIVREYGSLEAKRFLENASRMAIKMLDMVGFNFGISDQDVPMEIKHRIDELSEETQRKVEKLIQAYEAGELQPLPGRSLKETLEIRIMRELSELRNKAGELAISQLGHDNPGMIMAVSGARGSLLNVTQMAACIGQQSIRGERIQRGYTNRTLSSFKPGDLSPYSRGFVRSSYKDGLSPVEFFFHCTGGREGLVDTAVRTSQSGYLQRRMINAFMDLEVKPGGVVGDSSGDVVQFLYGEDGVFPALAHDGLGVDVDSIISKVLDEPILK